MTVPATAMTTAATTADTNHRHSPVHNHANPPTAMTAIPTASAICRGWSGSCCFASIAVLRVVGGSSCLAGAR